uniref:Uncharacterized protein n=1 Tax=Rhizophora mucronata TaxID=61149 RepID=A0A2P2PCX8_RHIMU
MMSCSLFSLPYSKPYLVKLLLLSTKRTTKS